MANETNYEALFQRDCGLGILAAERRWRFELLQGRKALGPTRIKSDGCLP
jgi:hypothetical protein